MSSRATLSPVKVAATRATSPKVRTKLFDVLIDNVDMAEAIREIRSFLYSAEKHFVTTPNVDHVVRLHKDADFFRIYKRASLVVPDGAPIIWASRLLGKPLKERVAGSDLVWPVCRLAAEERRRVYFLGGEEGVPGEAARVIKDAIPNFQLAGFYSPPFGFEKDDVENQKIVEMINKSRADVIFVALGAPKQEKWVAKHLNQLDIKVAVCVGAGLDFIAGTIKRAPKWVQKSGFEWAWRLTRDPKRLWKRYLVEDTAFLGIFFREWYRSCVPRRGKVDHEVMTR